jgi:hypothetical protein
MAAGLGFKTFAVGEVLSAANVNGYLMQGVLVFTNAAARDAAITSPQEGQFAFTKDNDSLWYYSGSAWVASGATGDIEGVTAGTGISGGGTSGTVTITNSMATTIDAKGDLIGGTGADTFARLAVGANDTVLTADSTATTGLKWATPASGGGMTLISEQTASASSSITFSSISGSYKQLMLIWSGIYVSALGNVFSLRFNNDSSTNYAVFSGKIGDSPLATAASGSAAGSNGATDATDTVTLSNGPFGYNTTNSTLYPKESQGMLLIDNYTSTSKYKAYELDWSHFYDGSTTGVWTKIKGVYKTTTAITSLDIFRQTGSGTFSNNTNTSIRLYGIS